MMNIPLFESNLAFLQACTPGGIAYPAVPECCALVIEAMGENTYVILYDSKLWYLQLHEATNMVYAMITYGECRTEKVEVINFFRFVRLFA